MAALSSAAGDAPSALAHLRSAAATEKCLSCGCLRGVLERLRALCTREAAPRKLSEAVEEAGSRLRDVRYDCLGCAVCHAAEIFNALHLEATPCSTAPVGERTGWPPLPGDYVVLRPQAPVAVCTLTDEDLARRVAASAGEEIALVGTLRTENLGIERLVKNMNANPHLLFLIVCGDESRAAVGHLPGQSLLALAALGIDEQGRIVGAEGARPFLKNISPEAIRRFRETVRVHDRIGSEDVESILDDARRCARENHRLVGPLASETPIPVIAGRLPRRTVLDPAGYCVIDVDRARNRLYLEHYRNDGVLDARIEGQSPAEVYTPAIEGGLISRLDHAAYLGRELTRAMEALRSGQPYQQDGAPQAAACSCGPEQCCPPKSAMKEE